MAWDAFSNWLSLQVFVFVFVLVLPPSPLHSSPAPALLLLSTGSRSSDHTSSIIWSPSVVFSDISTHSGRRCIMLSPGLRASARFVSSRTSGWSWTTMLNQSLPARGLHCVCIFSPRRDWTTTCVDFSARNLMNFSRSFSAAFKRCADIFLNIHLVYLELTPLTLQRTKFVFVFSFSLLFYTASAYCLPPPIRICILWNFSVFVFVCALYICFALRYSINTCLSIFIKTLQFQCLNCL